MFASFIVESFSRSHPFDTMSSLLDSMSKHYIEVRTWSKRKTKSTMPHSRINPISGFIVTSFFTFLLISIRVTHGRRRRICKVGSKIEIAGKFEEFVQLFAINNKENSSNQKLQNCWVAKTLMSSYILGKNWDFFKEKLPVTSGPNFQVKRNCNASSIFRVLLYYLHENKGSSI